jgi:hypothetical protein
MAEILRTLAQSAPGATSLTAIYTVPALTSTVLSSMIVCNRGATATTFRISIAVAGAADATKQYLYYDVPISKNNTFIATIGVTLATTDVVRVYAGNANLSFTLTGVEET